MEYMILKLISTALRIVRAGLTALGALTVVSMISWIISSERRNKAEVARRLADQFRWEAERLPEIGGTVSEKIAEAVADVERKSGPLPVSVYTSLVRESPMIRGLRLHEHLGSFDPTPANVRPG